MSVSLLARLVVAAALLGAAPLHAQRESHLSLAQGDRIRLLPLQPIGGVGSARLIGVLDAIEGDSLYVTLENGEKNVFQIGRLARVDVSRGMQRSTKVGLGIGATIGIITGIVRGEQREGDRQNCDSNIEPRCGLKLGPITVDASTAGYAVAGLAIGGIIGSQIKHEVWNGVSLSVHQGFALTLTIESSAGNRNRKNALPSRRIRR